MNNLQLPPPQKLFALLTFCGIRQRDVVKHLGVSKALVSLWRSGQREIQPEHYDILLDWAEARSYAQVTATQTIEERQAAINAFALALQEAHAERDPTRIYEQLLHRVETFHTRLQGLGDPTTWDDRTMQTVEADAAYLAHLTRRLQGHKQARHTTVGEVATTLANLRTLSAQLQEQAPTQ